MNQLKTLKDHKNPPGGLEDFESQDNSGSLLRENIKDSKMLQRSSL